MRFRPLPVLSLVCAAIFVLLLFLGKWQLERLAWKEALLIDVDRSANSQPITSSAQLARLLSDPEAFVEGRRVRLSGTLLDAPQGGFHFTAGLNQSSGWRQVVPFRMDNATSLYLAGLEPFPHADKSTPPMIPNDEITLAGYLQPARTPGLFSVDSSPDKNRWFHIDPYSDDAGRSWADISGQSNLDTALWIDVVQTGDAANADLPVRVPELKNDHLGYAMTWFSLAIILLIMYIYFHIQAGRLSFKA